MLAALAMLAVFVPVAPGASAPSIPAPAPVVRQVHYTDNVDGWTRHAFAELAQHGTPRSQLGGPERKAVAIIAWHESRDQPGSSPGSPGYYCDSNCVAGTPSEGLVQLVPAAMAQYGLPGHQDRLNPVDSIMAGTRYAIDRYGSLDNVPGVQSVRAGGSYVGY